jgi:hypothetical protein
MTTLSLARLARLVLTLSFAAVGCAAPAEEPEELGSSEAHVTGNPDSPDRVTIVRSYGYGVHLTTVREAPQGFQPEAAFYTRMSGSRGVWLCSKGKRGNFPSNDPNCEGYPIVDFLGYADQNAAGTRAPLYRCAIPSLADHFISLDPGCESQVTEGVLGYVEGGAPLPAMIPAPVWGGMVTGDGA